MEIREHHGYGHGLRPGTTADMNCPSCKREDSKIWNVAVPVVALVAAPDAKTAERKLRDKIREAGLEPYEGTVESMIPAAFESEYGTEAQF